MNKTIIKRMKNYGNNCWFTYNQIQTIIVTPYSVVAVNGNADEEDNMTDAIKEKIGEFFDADFATEPLNYIHPVILTENIRELAGRRRDRVGYSFGKDLPAVNARYLKDIIELIDGYDIYYKNNKNAIKIIGTKGIGYLLPICKLSNEDWKFKNFTTGYEI